MKYFLINHEALQSGSFPPEYIEYVTAYRKQFCIVDESSKFKTNNARKENKKSKRTQAIQLLNKIGHRCILTGTFISKSPVNAYDQMEILKENYFGCDMFTFERRHCVMIRMPIGRGFNVLIDEDRYASVHKALVKARKIGEWQYEDVKTKIQTRFAITDRDIEHIESNSEYTPFKNVDKLYEIVAKDCMIVRKADCFDMPKRVYKTVNITLTDEMKKLYNDILNRGFTDALVCDNTMSLFHCLQDVCNGYIPENDTASDNERAVILKKQKENLKINALLDTVEEIGVPEHKVIVWSNRSMLLEDAYEALISEGYRVCKYDGKTSKKDKDAIEEAFKNNEYDIFIANQHSGGYGLDFLKVCTYSIFLSNDHSVEVRVQAEERAERGEIKESRTVIDITVSGTIEDRVARSLLRGKELLSMARTSRDVFELEEMPVF